MNDRERHNDNLDESEVARNDNEGPALEQADWDAIGARGMKPSDASPNGDLRFEDEPSGELPDEDDDNEYQESDEALPDDEEERAIARNPAKKGGRFDEV
jgi:hypothetical protein